MLQQRDMVWADIETITVRPVDDTALEDIIRKPLQSAGYGIDDDLVAALLLDATKFDRAELPARLSFVLRKLCEACAEEKVLHLPLYASRRHQATSGGPLDEMIADSAEAAFDRAGPSVKESAAWRQALFEALIGLDQRRLPIRRLAGLHTVPVQAHGLVRELLAAGLLSLYAGPDGEFIEIGSQVLFKAWPRLSTSVEAISDDPILIVSHREVTAAPEPIEGSDLGHSDRKPVSTKRRTFKTAGLQAAAASLAFLAGLGVGLALLPKVGSWSLIGHDPSEKLAQEQADNLAAMTTGADGPAQPGMAAYGPAGANAKVENWKLALRLRNRHQLTRERRDRALAEAQARDARAALEQTRSSLASAQQKLQELQKTTGSLDGQLNSERADAETNAAKIAELTARLATQARERTAALEAADTARRSLGEEQQAWKSSQAAATGASEKAAHDLENRLKVAEAATAEASQALASERAAKEASELAALNIEHRLRETAEKANTELNTLRSEATSAASEADRLRQELSQERSLRVTAEKKAGDLENLASRQVLAPSELEKPRGEREFELKKATEEFPTGHANSEQTAAADIEKLRGELVRERSLREAAVKSITDHMKRLGGQQAKKASPYDKAKQVIARERRLRIRAEIEARAAQQQAERYRQSKSSGWKAISPIKSKAWRRSNSWKWQEVLGSKDKLRERDSSIEFNIESPKNPSGKSRGKVDMPTG